MLLSSFVSRLYLHLRSLSLSAYPLQCAIALALACLMAPAAGADTAPTDREERIAPYLEAAREVLAQTPLVDGHNDVPWSLRRRTEGRLDELDLAVDTAALEFPMHTDLARLETSGIGAQFWSVFVPVDYSGAEATLRVLEQIDIVYRLARRHPENLEMAFTADDIRRIHGEGRVASLIGIEGGHAIASSLAVLRQLYNAGARYMTLTHSANTTWCDSSTDAPEHGGLSPFGVEVVREMNRMGMLVDLSHVSAEAMADALDATRAPVIFSHSSAFGLTAHPRNVPDDILRRTADNGGVVMVTFVTSFISEDVRHHGAARAGQRAVLEGLHPGDPERVREELAAWGEAQPWPVATLEDVADHVDHLVKIAGIDHVGIGSDFDGIRSTPDGLEGVDRLPHLVAELLARGYSRDDAAKIVGGNALRVMDAVEATARRLDAEEPPSEMLFDDDTPSQGPDDGQ